MNHGYSSDIACRCIISRERTQLVLVEAKDHLGQLNPENVKVKCQGKKHGYSALLAHRWSIQRGSILLVLAGVKGHQRENSEKLVNTIILRKRAFILTILNHVDALYCA